VFGTEYILNLFNNNPNQIADEFGIARQSVYAWIRKKKIPKKRVKQLSDKFQIPEEYFNKELTKSEMMRIEIIKLNNEDVAYEVPFTDDEGNEVGTTTHYENEWIIRHLGDEEDRMKKMESLLKKIEKTIYFEDPTAYLKNPYCDNLNSDASKYSDNLEVFSSVVNVLSLYNNDQQNLLKLLLVYLNLDNMRSSDGHKTFGFYTGRLGRSMLNSKNPFEKEFLELLFKHDIISSEILKEHIGK
jgi:predicted DNA-binding protein YlxM (UPF0122 family)